MRLFTSSKISITIALLLSLFAFNSNVAAEACDAPSPNLISSSDEYYDFDKVKTFSNEEKDKLNRLFKRLSGKWQGKSIIVDCFGTGNSSKKQLKNAIINIDNQPDSTGSLTIKLNQKMIEDRINTSEVWTLLVPNNTFYLSFLTDNHLTFSEKYRRKNFSKKVAANIASSNTVSIINKNNLNITTSSNTPKPKQTKTSTRLIEIIYELTLDNGVFTLLRSYYTNGVYTGEEKWSLRAN